MNAESKISADDRKKYPATVNGKNISVDDPVPMGRQVLDAAGFVPPDECVLIQGFAHGTRAVGLDETIDLSQPEIEAFYAFRSDRIFRLTIEERGFDWGSARIKEPTLRSIAHVPDDEILFLERTDQPDLELGPDDELDLSKPGTEHLRCEKRLIEVFFKDQPYQIQRGVYTTEQLMAKFPIEQGYLLNLLKPDGELVILKPGEKIRVKCGMRFFSQVPGGGSS